MTQALWDYVAPLDGWCDNLAQLIERWGPPQGMAVEALRLRNALHRAARERQGWLYHPCLAALTLPGAGLVANALQLVLWTAAHSDEELGYFTVDADVWAWSPTGGRGLAPGRYDPSNLVRGLYADSGPSRFSIDVWGDTLGHPYPADFPYPGEWCWQHDLPLTEASRLELEDEIRAILGSLTALERTLPQCAAWVAAVTRVIYPIHKPRSASFKSGSLFTLPGAVFIESRKNQILLLEALVHESAHLHFYRAEAVQPLVEPGHTATYTSPLRSDPRPLRGIFLAYHALAHMCALYSTTEVLNSSPACADELTGLNSRRDSAGQTLAEQQQHLTDAGLRLYEQTRELAGVH